MKRLLVLGLMLVLTLSITSMAWAAIHSNEGEIFETDTWYSIAPATPYWQVGSHNAPDADYSLITGEFYLNDQTFANATIVNGAYDQNYDLAYDVTELSGSYLFDSGFFVGLAYNSEDYEDYDVETDATTVSAGYRYNIKKNGYLAFSFDYRDSEGAQRIVALDTDFRYYTKNMKIAAELVKPEDSKMVFEGGVNFRADKNVVLGINLFDDAAQRHYDLGLTWTPKPLIVDVQLGEAGVKNEAKAGFFRTNVMFNLNKALAFGVGYEKYETSYDPQFWLNAKFSTKIGKFKFMYAPETEHYSDEFKLAYYSKL